MPTQSFADQYAARVDAVLEQRTRLRGPQPPHDLWESLAPDHILMRSDPHQPLDPNLVVVASYIEPDDVVIDVGGGAGRVSLPIAMRCKELVNVEPSAAMCAGFDANVARAGLTNTRILKSEWPTSDAPTGTVALVSHVTYLTREIVPFIELLEQVGQRRVLITVGDPVPPSWHHVLYQLLHDEIEEVVPGHQLANVLWELGIRADVRYLPLPPGSQSDFAAPTREEAIENAMTWPGTDQWTHWPLSGDQESRLRHILETRFDELFFAVPEGFSPDWIEFGREVLITWQPSDGRSQ